MKNKFWGSISIIAFLILSQTLKAQVDSVLFKSGEFVVGELKSMDKGVLKIETDYSDSDFQIEWQKVIGVKTSNQFMITLSNGKKYFGKLQSTSESTIMLLTLNNGNFPCKNQEIVSLSPFNEKFADRISAISAWDMTWQRQKIFAPSLPGAPLLIGLKNGPPTSPFTPFAQNRIL